MLEEAVAPPYKEHLLGVIPKNLVRADSASLLEHFVPRRPSAAHTSPEESA